MSLAAIEIGLMGCSSEILLVFCLFGLLKESDEPLD